MSAFLGPIHHWLYRKIMVQESIVKAILSLNEKKSFVTGLSKEVNEHCGSIEEKPLEEMIDTDNIHGWLQERVGIVESRLSYVVTAIVKEDANRMKDILDAVYHAGRNLVTTLDQEKTINRADEVYQLLNDILLDGMPCDHVNEVMVTSEEEVVYKSTRCIHEAYWLEQGGLVMYYYDIREKLIEGILADTPYQYEMDDASQYHIRRK